MLTLIPSKETPFIDSKDGIALAQAVVDTVRDPLVVLDQDLRVVAVSRSFCQIFRLVRDDVRGHLLYEIDGGQWDIPELRELLETISNGQAVIEAYEVEREFPAIGHRVMLLNARKVYYETGTHSTILLAFEDVTGRRSIERQVEELLREKEMLLQADPDVYFETDHYKGWPSLLVRLGRIGDEELRHRLEAAWLRQAPKKLVKSRHVDPKGSDDSRRNYTAAGN